MGRITPGLDKVPPREGTCEGHLTSEPWAALKVWEVKHLHTALPLVSFPASLSSCLPTVLSVTRLTRSPICLTFIPVSSPARASSPDTTSCFSAPCFPQLSQTQSHLWLTESWGQEESPSPTKSLPSLPRQEVINHVQVVREAGAAYKAQNLYLFLENVDRLQNLQLQAWTDKQRDLEEKRRECLSSMVTMFPKVGLPPGDLLRGQHSRQGWGQGGAMGLWGVPGRGRAVGK